jgi:hypothetical protein
MAVAIVIRLVDLDPLQVLGQLLSAMPVAVLDAAGDESAPISQRAILSVGRGGEQSPCRQAAVLQGNMK